MPFSHITHTIHPPKGFVFLARRLNRHRYHLTPGANTKRKAEHGRALCGANDETMSNDALSSITGAHKDKVCRDCCALTLSPAARKKLAMVKAAFADEQPHG